MRHQAAPFRSAAAGLAVALAVVTGPAPAQTYPTQPIKIIVATAPAGLADLVARTLAQKLSEGGHAAVVENRAGAAGAVGADAAAKAPPDGHTLFIGMHSTNAILPHLVADLKYDGIKDFVPITNIATSANILVVHPAVPAASIAELVAYAKANPGKLTYASQGNGTSGHIVGEQFKKLAGIDIVHVPYRGAAPAIQDLVAGQVSMMFDVVPLAKPQLAAGKVRALAVASPQRHPAVPDVPTCAEAGFPQLEGGPWFGLMAPAGTPRAIVDWLNREAHKAFTAADVRERFLSQGVTLPLGTPEEFSAFVASESNRWREIIRTAAIRME
ncbi:MAG: Bug family tripartite tricarboxylate transporter substrate binding protein [Xanthobacteraceae bacterium]